MHLNTATLPLAWALRHIGMRIRLRGWERLLRALFHPDRQRRFAFEIPFNGYRYPAYADNFVDWNALFYGAYEAFELTLLAAMAGRMEGAVFLDVGANVGHHALYMAARAGTVHAFEPNPELWPLIEQKVSRNGLANVTLHRCGLGARADRMALYLSPECGEASLIAGASRTSASSGIPVTIVRGDDYFGQNEISRLDIVKMDIEGFETYALEGMASHLEQFRPVVMVELSEIGKRQFGDFQAFVAAFPTDYDFWFCQQKSDPVIGFALGPGNARIYEHFAGNVFCVPAGRKGLFMEQAGKFVTAI